MTTLVAPIKALTLTTVLLPGLALVLVLSDCGSGSEAEEHYSADVELQAQGKFEEAIAEYDEAIRLDPDLAVAYNDRGVAYQGLGQPQRTIEDFGGAIRLNPQLADAYANRALAHTVLGRDADAQQDVERAVELGFVRSVSRSGWRSQGTSASHMFLRALAAFLK